MEPIFEAKKLVDKYDKSNADLRLHWALSEYFEAVHLQKIDPKKKTALVAKLHAELFDCIQREPVVFARQLPLLFGHVQKLLKLNPREATQIDANARLLNAIKFVSTAGKCVFRHEQAFETFIELFLNTIAKSNRIRQWENVLDRLAELLNAYLYWNPTQAMVFVNRNKSTLLNLQRQCRSLLSLRQFIDSFPQIFHIKKC